METSLFSCLKHTGPMPFLGRPNHHDVKGYGICVLYVDNAMAIMATMSDGRVDKNEVCLQFCLVYYLSLSDMRGHCQSQIQLLAFFDSRNTPTTFNVSRRGLFLSPVNLLRLLLYIVRETVV